MPGYFCQPITYGIIYEDIQAHNTCILHTRITLHTDIWGSSRTLTHRIVLTVTDTALDITTPPRDDIRVYRPSKQKTLPFAVLHTERPASSQQ